MAWTVPMTFIDGTVLTAAQLNTNLRDNFLETIPAKSTGNGGAGAGHFAIQGPYQIAERGVAYSEVNTYQSTAETNYGDLATVGPSVSIQTGTNAWVLFSAEMASDDPAAETTFGIAISGATEIEARDDLSVCTTAGGGAFNSYMNNAFVTDLTPGVNVFTMKYKASQGDATFGRRHLWVMAF